MFKKISGGLVFLLFPIFLHAQAVSPVTPRVATIAVGGYFSFGGTDYGQNLGFSNRAHPDAYGPGFYGDFDYRVWGGLGVGIEGEARFLDFGTPGPGIFEQNFLIGPRATYTLGRRWEPYVKFLAGGSRFHYPTFISNKVYDYTTYAGGGGLDVHLDRHWTVRPADFEYQHWDFPPTGLTPWVYSAGVSYRFF
ncbi:MAG: outer membrane beta-barrel protein [Acidobacteriaceae bacterium]